MSADSSPGRRLTEDDERRSAELYRQGASERDVAEALGCSASTAHRLRERLQAAQGDVTADGEIAGAVDDAMREGLLAELGVKREELAGILTDLEARAQASRDAIAALERERLELISEGKDAAPLRPRMQSARDDLADWETAAAMARQNLGTADARIAEVRAAAELAALRAELDVAVAERDQVYAATGDRQRAAVAASRAAAEEFVGALADEQAAAGRVSSLLSAIAVRAQAAGEAVPAVPATSSTALSVLPSDAPSGPPLALLKAVREAAAGNVAAVSARLGEAFGWLPPGPPTEAELEQRRRIQAERDRQVAEQRAKEARGIHNPEDDRLVAAGLDVDGVPMNRYGDRLEPRGRLPHPLDVFGYPQAGSGLYGPGYRQGW